MNDLLTRRQCDVLLLAANGITNTQIAQQLMVSPGAVAKDLGKAFRTLGARDRTQAVALAMKLGVFGVDEVRLPKPLELPQTGADLGSES